MMSSYFRCNIKDFYEEVNFDQKTEKEKELYQYLKAYQEKGRKK